MNILLYICATGQVILALYFQFTGQPQEATLAMTWAIFATLVMQGDD